MCFSLESFSPIIRAGQPILVDLIDLAVFLSQIALLRWLTFLFESLTVTLKFLVDFFLCSHSRISSTMTFPPLGNSDHVIVSVSIDFLSYSQWDALFHRIPYDCSCVDWNSLFDHLTDVSC